jgi:hypothetical protein
VRMQRHLGFLDWSGEERPKALMVSGAIGLELGKGFLDNFWGDRDLGMITHGRGLAGTGMGCIMNLGG